MMFEMWSAKWSWRGYEGQPEDLVLHQKKMQQILWYGGKDLRRSEAEEASFWVY